MRGVVIVCIQQWIGIVAGAVGQSIGTRADRPECQRAEGWPQIVARRSGTAVRAACCGLAVDRCSHTRHVVIVLQCIFHHRFSCADHIDTDRLDAGLGFDRGVVFDGQGAGVLSKTINRIGLCPHRRQYGRQYGSRQAVCCHFSTARPIRFTGPLVLRTGDHTDSDAGLGISEIRTGADACSVAADRRDICAAGDVDIGFDVKTGILAVIARADAGAIPADGIDDAVTFYLDIQRHSIITQ